MIGLIREFCAEVEKRVRSLDVEAADEAERREIAARARRFNVRVSQLSDAIRVNGEIAAGFGLFEEVIMLHSTPAHIRQAVINSDEVKAEVRRRRDLAEKESRRRRERERAAWDLDHEDGRKS